MIQTTLISHSYYRICDFNGSSSYLFFVITASVRSMRYTEGSIPRYACCEDVLQIFSVQVTETKDGLEWPLQVYGWVATRDSVDQNRNLLFSRTRDNSQILTQEVYICISMYAFCLAFFFLILLQLVLFNCCCVCMFLYLLEGLLFHLLMDLW